jgi:capsular polysaccharide transport system permease protein
LQDQLITTETQLAQLQDFTPDNPQIPVLQTMAASLRREVEKQTSEIAGSRKSLSDVAVEYQRLYIESQFADKQLTTLLASLAEARSEARKQAAYIERIAQPSRPDKAVEPKRLRGIFTTFVLGLIAFGILSMLLAGVREHRD